MTKYWTHEKAIETAKQFDSRVELRKSYNGALKYIYRNNLEDKALGHMKTLRVSWTKEAAFELSKKYNSLASFMKEQKGCYLWIVRNGFIDELLGHLPRTNHIYTYEECADLIKSVSTRNEFVKKYPLAYKQAYRRDWLESLFKDMPKVSLAGRYKISNEYLADLAKNFSSIAEFVYTHPSEYSAARKRGILSEICSHMVRKGSENDVVYIWEYVGKTFNDKKVYKIGVSSSRIGVSRIYASARNFGTEARLIVFCNVNGKATDIESKILALGESPRIIGIDGCSELRALSTEELKEAISMITGDIAI